MGLSDCIRVYHYTNPKAWHQMNNGCPDNYFMNPETGHYVDGMLVRGLWPKEYFMTSLWDLPVESEKRFTRALLEPEPDSWKNNPDYPDVWNFLWNNLDKLNSVTLLEVIVKPTDEAYVAERAFAEKALRTQCKELSRQEKNQLLVDYWNSRVPLYDYKVDYSVPEVLIANPIPLDQLKLVWTKPYAEVRQLME